MSEHLITVVGATGAVGREALSILAARGIPASQLIAVASSRSAGERIPYGDATLAVTDQAHHAIGRSSVALLCADAATSRELVPVARAAGCIAIDNSSAFRLDPAVPLVVPEINGHLLDGSPPVIANPNCSTVILLSAVEPLRREFGIEALDVATYQAVSGAGAAAIDELRTQARDVLEGREPQPAVFREPCAFNLFSHDSAVDLATGLNGEEQKIIDESRKILGQTGLRVTPTCVRVPVIRAHTQAITVTLSRAADEDAIRAALARHAAPCGVRVVDDRAGNAFPTPQKASGIDPVLVGRIRPDPGEVVASAARLVAKRWCLLASGDQLRKGAALNAVQIAERLGLLPGATGLAASRSIGRLQPV